MLPKASVSSVEQKLVLPDIFAAPIKEGDEIGNVEFWSEGKVIGEIPIVADESVEKINFFQIFTRMLARFLLI